MRWTRVIAGVAVFASCLTPIAAQAVDPTAEPSSTPTSSPTDGSTAPAGLDVPDPLAIAPSALSELTALAMRYEANLAVAEERRANAAEKQKDADHQRTLARAYVAQVVDYAMSPTGDPFAQKLAALTAAENPEDLITGVFSTEQVTEAQEGHLADAKRAFIVAESLQKRADAQVAEATKAERTATRQLRQISDLADQLGLGATSTPAGLPETRIEQREWNTEASQSWRSYRRKLARMKVTVPKAAALRAEGGHTTATVGSRKVEVLPRQTLAMVDALVDRIGDDYAARSGGEGWTCGGLVDVRGGYNLQGTPAQLYATTVRVDPDDIRRGDLVFSANAASGIHHVGVYIGNDRVIDAPATRAQVGVSAMPEKPYAVTRPALGTGRNDPPKGTAAKPTTVCSATKPAGATRQGWTFPLKQGTYNVSAGFGQSGGMWQSTHTGQDLSAPTGTPIYASRGGTVSLQEVGWAGTLITVEHPDGTAERYAHASKVLVEDGQTVASGDEIALVGARGNTTGPHLHFEITVDGEFIDPMPVLVQFLTNSGAGTGWGGYGNGQVPRGVLCQSGDVLLRCDVARRVDSLATRFERKFGHPLTVTAGYRDLVGQIERGPKGTLRDIPGTSPFGWGTRFTVAQLTKRESQWLTERAENLGLRDEGNLSWSRSPI